MTPVELADGLYVGNGYLLGASHVYAAQSYHYRQMGWTRATCPGPTHRDYLGAEGDTWLTLNWVDGPARLFEWSRAWWPRAFDFIDGRLANEWPVAIVCDQGQSRSPTLAMAYLAHRTDELGRAPSFEDALAAFCDLYPAYLPKWDGIAGWVRDSWDSLDAAQ